MSIHKLLIFIIAVTSLLATACSVLTGVTPTSQANSEGNNAYLAHRYDEALVKYQRSLAAAEQSGDKQYAAIAMFGLARTYAQLCQENNAEKWFKQSISVRETLPDNRNAYITQNFLESGRFLASRSRNEDAVKLYDRAMPILESTEVEKKTLLDMHLCSMNMNLSLRPLGEQTMRLPLPQKQNYFAAQTKRKRRNSNQSLIQTAPKISASDKPVA
jgi:tetratricopeptide (TPR) repeat protein